MKKLLINKIISNLLADLPTRQKEILKYRYGLANSQKMTLAEIGGKYGITRERIRQIENLALTAVKIKTNQKDFENFIRLVVNYLGQKNDVRKENLLNADLKKMVIAGDDYQTFANKVVFLLEISNKINYHPADNNYYSFWYVNETACQKAIAFIGKLTEILIAGQDWKTEMKNIMAENYLSISKKFAFNSYQDFGLAAWPHINPKTARDWAFLVLRKNKRPLHFTELAKIINTLRKDRITNVQTVHNELIKDDRFVLVGRGVYGLKEFNLMAGTCKEVISHILKENGPQTAKNLIKLVNSKRDFKENTLILNLQSKKHFLRLSGGRYSLREL